MPNTFRFDLTEEFLQFDIQTEFNKTTFKIKNDAIDIELTVDSCDFKQLMQLAGEEINNG